MVVVLVGPTASGKSLLAAQLAQSLGTVVINADSRQVYRELNVGVAKPTAAELTLAPHHLIGHVSIQQAYSAGQWAREATACLENVFSEDARTNSSVNDEAFVSTNFAVVAGGAGLHIKALVDGIPDMPTVPSEIRDHYDERLHSQGLSHLNAELKSRDPVYYEEVAHDNPRRIVRALSVIEASGKPFSYWRARPKHPLPYDVRWIVLEPDREQLYSRIEARVEAMLANGLEGEAREFAGFRDLDALQTIGYSEWWPYFDDPSATPRSEVIRLIKRNSRRYARRQTTWNRKLEGLRIAEPALAASLAFVT